MAIRIDSFETSKNSKYTAYISCAVFIIVYVLSAIGSLKFATINSSISPVWPPSGLSIGFLLLFGPRYFYCVFIGALIANFYTSGEVLSSSLIAGGNCIEAVVGFFTVHWIRSQLNNYEHLKNLMAILVSSLFASVFSASVGTLTLMAISSLSIEHFSAAWLTWWIADVVGSLFIVPLLLFFLETKKFSSIFYTLKQKAGLIFLITGTLVAAYYLLQLENSLKLIFLLFPILLLISQIRQRFLVYLFSVILGIIPIYLTVTGKGPFVHSGFNQNLLNLEIFIIALLTTSICIIGTTNLSAQWVINTIYLVGWVLWGTIFYYISDSHHKNDEQRMSHQMSLIEQSIETQINIYVNYLAGAKGLFEASDEVKPIEWKKYVAALDLVARGTGLSGMGVIQKVKNSELASFVKKQEKETGLNMKINDLPGGSTSPEITEKYIVSLIEPFDSNSNALGLNIASEVKRKTTADLAAAKGKPVLSEATHIYQDKGNRPGFLLYMPVYKKNFPLSSEENRIASTATI